MEQLQTVTKRTALSNAIFQRALDLPEAGWAQADLFVLSRMGGTAVIRWETVDDGSLRRIAGRRNDALAPGPRRDPMLHADVPARHLDEEYGEWIVECRRTTRARTSHPRRPGEPGGRGRNCDHRERLVVPELATPRRSPGQPTRRLDGGDRTMVSSPQHGRRLMGKVRLVELRQSCGQPGTVRRRGGPHLSVTDVVTP